MFLSKVLVNRLKCIIENLINLLQASFIPGRQTSGNILMAQEIIHIMTKSKVKKGGLMFKMDLDKAYDKVRWSYLIETLVLFNFLVATIRLIQSCISTSSMDVL